MKGETFTQRFVPSTKSPDFGKGMVIVMNIYEKNIKSMKVNKDSLAKSLEEKDYNAISNKIDNIKSIDTRDANKAIVVEHEGIEYRLNSVYRPISEANKWVEQFDIKSLNTVINMFGLGNGYFARTIIEKMGKEDCLLIFEPSYEIFIHAINNYDLSDIISNEKVFIFINNINEEEFRKTSTGLTTISNINSQMQVMHPKYDDVFKEEAIFFFENLKDSFTSMTVNTNTLITFAKRNLSNLFKNLKYLKESSSLNELKDIIVQGIPAIVVAAGPSVEENIAELKKAKGKAFIVAVDRILDYLLESGLEPDLVVTIDGMKETKYFSKREDIMVPLLTYPEANYEILDWHKGKKIFCTNNSFTGKIYSEIDKKPPFVIPSGSVALVAYSACVELGFKEIILVGQDLAFGKDKTHAGDINEVNRQTKEVMVEGLDGERIKSRYDWKEFILRYEDLIPLSPDVKIIDAKEYGAKIKGTENISLAKVMEKYNHIKLNKNEIENKLDKTFNEEELKKTTDYLLRSLKALDKIKEKSKEAIDDCSTLAKEENQYVKTRKFTDTIDRISKANKYIENTDIYEIMDSYIMAKSTDELSNIYKFTDDIAENSLSTFEKSKRMYENVIEVADYIYPRLEKLIDEF